MYRRYAVRFNKQQVEFINCVNLVERIKKARALSEGIAHLGVKRLVVSSSNLGKQNYVTVKQCT